MAYSNFCRSCPKNKTCTELCLNAERYASQDYVPQQELTLPDPYSTKKIPFISATYLTIREKEIVTLMGKGLSRRDISQTLDITRNALRINIHRLKTKGQIL